RRADHVPAYEVSRRWASIAEIDEVPDTVEALVLGIRPDESCFALRPALPYDARKELLGWLSEYEEPREGEPAIGRIREKFGPYPGHRVPLGFSVYFADFSGAGE